MEDGDGDGDGDGGGGGDGLGVFSGSTHGCFGNDCLEGRRTGGDLEPGEARYGAWLRALPSRVPRQPRADPSPPFKGDDGTAKTSCSHAHAAGEVNAESAAAVEKEGSSAAGKVREETSFPMMERFVEQISEAGIACTERVGYGLHANSNLRLEGDNINQLHIPGDKDEVVVVDLNGTRAEQVPYINSLERDNNNKIYMTEDENDVGVMDLNGIGTEHVRGTNSIFDQNQRDPQDGSSRPKKWKKRARMQAYPGSLLPVGAARVGGKRKSQMEAMDEASLEGVRVVKKQHVQQVVTNMAELSAEAVDQLRRVQ
ncbi:hypothetical protein FCV25MIE_09691 [Fagus crenata]